MDVGAARDPVPPQRDQPAAGESPPRGGAILTVLILGAVVANINLAIANVALPSIGAALDSSQAELNLVAVGFTLGLASSVLYLGALADRYGRKPAMMLGAALSVPASLLAAWAPSGTVPIAVLVVVLAGLWLPRHAGETSEPVDHLGGVLSVVSIGPEKATCARVAERQPHPRRDARPEPEPDPGAQAAEPDVPP
jgi:hypothetical protein